MDPHVLAGAYALDALPQEEAAVFERHLADCEACAAEVREFHTTAARLGAAVAEPPPPGLREAVLSAIDTTRPHSVTTLRPRRDVGWARRMLVPVAAALGAGVLTLSVVGDDDRRRPLETVEVSQAAIAVLAAPDARTTVLETDGGVRARMHVASSTGYGVLVAQGLEPLDGGRVYELWLYRDGQPEPAGLLPVGAAGEGLAVLTEDVDDARQVAVTIEPEGGVPAPTGPVVAQAALE